jgi:uncharacterized membrane protein SirB2
MVSWLAEFYPALRWLHLTAVGASVLLFASRGLGVLAGSTWPMQRHWRRLSVVIDVVLLMAGALLWWALQHHPLREPWLATKLALLPAYVVLGSFALKRARTRAARGGFLVAALVCVLTMASIARSRHPAGWLTFLGV